MPLRIALVGIGSAASRAHLPILSEAEAAGRVTLVGICDPDPARRQAVAAGHPGTRSFADNETMLDATAPDLLVIATPPSAHLDEMESAAMRGIHVLCEKPLGLNDRDVEALRGLAATHPDLALATVHQYRYAAPWRWMARAIAGALRVDEPFTLRVGVERPGTDPLAASGWRTDPEREGGILGDHAVHYLALLTLLDPGCAVLACHREGPGGREVASVDATLGNAGRAHIDVSYAGDHRSNVLRLDRAAQCLEIAWEDAVFAVVHNGRPSPPRAVDSLSDRAVVNALYAPMYDELIGGLAVPRWRTEATDATIRAAALLAAAVGIAAGS